MNPGAYNPDEFNEKLREDDTVNELEKERILEVAQLVNSSTLVKSYELLI